MHLPEFVLVAGTRRSVVRGLAVLVLRKRKIIEGQARQAGLDDALANIWLGYSRELSSARAFEVSELDDLHRGIRLANRVALRRARGCRIILDVGADHRGRFAHERIAQYACADNGNESEKDVKPGLS